MASTPPARVVVPRIAYNFNKLGVSCGISGHVELVKIIKILACGAGRGFWQQNVAPSASPTASKTTRNIFTRRVHELSTAPTHPLADVTLNLDGTVLGDAETESSTVAPLPPTAPERSASQHGRTVLSTMISCWPLHEAP